MRSLVILGVLLLVLGLFTYVMPVLQSTQADQSAGAGYSVSRSVTSTLDIPTWASAAAMVTGLVFIIAGASVRPRSY